MPCRQGHSDRAGDAYHSALCDLDRSEMYLELNLTEEAGELAERALARFGELRMVYEEAKAVTNLALATSRRGDVRRARQLFSRARHLFGRERNGLWLALVDFYEALVLFRDGQHGRARTLGEGARRRFARASSPARAAFCDLLLARLELQAGNLRAAESACDAIFERTAGAETPILSYQSHFVRGLIREARGKSTAALESFRNAHAALEQLRGRLQGDDLKVAFLEDKQAVARPRVRVARSAPRAGDQRAEAAFGYRERITQPGRSHRVSRGVDGAAGRGQDDRGGAQTGRAQLALSQLGQKKPGREGIRAAHRRHAAAQRA